MQRDPDVRSVATGADSRGTATVRVAVGLGLMLIPSLGLIWLFAGFSDTAAAFGVAMIGTAVLCTLTAHVAGRRRSEARV